MSAGSIKPFVYSNGASYASKDSTIRDRVVPGGVYLKTNLSKLIEGVYVTPHANWPVGSAVSAVTKAFGLAQGLVKRTSMNQIPFDKLQFHDV